METASHATPYDGPVTTQKSLSNIQKVMLRVEAYLNANGIDHLITNQTIVNTVLQSAKHEKAHVNVLKKIHLRD